MPPLHSGAGSFSLFSAPALTADGYDKVYDSLCMCTEHGLVPGAKQCFPGSYLLPGKCWCGPSAAVSSPSKVAVHTWWGRPECSGSSCSPLLSCPEELPSVYLTGQGSAPRPSAVLLSWPEEVTAVTGSTESRQSLFTGIPEISPQKKTNSAGSGTKEKRLGIA